MASATDKSASNPGGLSDGKKSTGSGGRTTPTSRAASRNRDGVGNDATMTEHSRPYSLMRQHNQRNPSPGVPHKRRSVPSPLPTVPLATNSAVPSREPSPVRTLAPSIRSASSSRAASRSRKNSQEISPSRSSAAGGLTYPSIPSASAVQRALLKSTKPQFSPQYDESMDVSQPDQSVPSQTDDPTKQQRSQVPPVTARSPHARRTEPESTQSNTSSKRSSVTAAEPERKLSTPEPEVEDSTPPALRTPTRGTSLGLETVQEGSLPSTPATDRSSRTIKAAEESRLDSVDEDGAKSVKNAGESGSDSGGNKSAGPKGDEKRTSLSAARPGDVLSKRSYTSLDNARGKAGEGSVRNMIVETETVSSVPQLSLGVVPGERGSGRIDSGGSVRMKASTETIRPKKEKKRHPRKPTSLHSGPVSSKADAFEAKVASAVDEAASSDSDETFVYESNPPDPHPARQHRYHSRTPSTTSMASQIDQYGGRSRASQQGVTTKRSMKFTNTYNSNLDGDWPDEGSGRGSSRLNGTGNTRHHVGRYGRTGGHTSLLDNESPFPSQGKPPRHLIGGSGRNGKPNSPRTVHGYRTITGPKKNGDAYGYDFDGEGADDERTPLVGSVRINRSRHGRRPNSASLRQLEYMEQRRRGCFSRNGGFFLILLMIIALVGGATTFTVTLMKPLEAVYVTSIQNVLASEQEIMLDLDVQATNPNLFPISVTYVDMNVFAKSRHVGGESFWRHHGSHLEDFPRVRDSRKRAAMARAVQSSSDADTSSLEGNHDRSVVVRDGIDEGTDPMLGDPAGDPQTMLLGRIFEFDSPLTFEPSPWKRVPSNAVGQLRLAKPGNRTEEGGTERWERVLQYPFDLIVRGVVKYQLPLSSNFRSASVCSKVRVTPDNDADDDNDGGDNGHNKTVTISARSSVQCK